MTKQATPLQQEMLILAFAADANLATLTGDPKKDEREIAAKISSTFFPAVQQQFGRQWSFIWGPAVKVEPVLASMCNPFNLAYRIVNAAYVAADDAGNYVIGVAGTDFRSMYDWLVEDASVFTQDPWKSVAPQTSAPSTALVSHSAVVSLTNLLDLSPVSGMPGATLKLQDVLSNIAGSPGTVYIAGHSLGGALTALLSLWIEDEKQAYGWNNLTLAPYAYAGPSPGNGDFSTWFGQRLPQFQRIWNAVDVVPNAWNYDQMTQTLATYKGSASPPPNWVLEGATLLADGVKSLGYEQVFPGTPALEGSQLLPQITDFVCQVLWQHTLAYPWLLNVQMPNGGSIWPKTCGTLPTPPSTEGQTSS